MLVACAKRFICFWHMQGKFQVTLLKLRPRHMALQYGRINHPYWYRAKFGEQVHFLGAGGELNVGLRLRGTVSRRVEVFDAPEGVGSRD